ncbi:MAG: helix-turn-helix domain-containing protein [Pyrinomonadaceae bacterium]
MASSKAVIPNDSELVTVAEARRILGISANKMSALIGSGTLPYEQDPLDRRVKLVKRAEVEGLMRKRTQSR